jgi:Zn-dependent M28 family amino/carboxypeptidase
MNNRFKLKMKNNFTILVFLLVHSIIFAQEKEEAALKGLGAINRDVIHAQLEFLSSDWMEGRQTGEKGERISSDYIASMLQLYGVKPWGDETWIADLPDRSNRTYFQNFLVRETTPGTEQSLKLFSATEGGSKVVEFTNNIDFIVRPSGSFVIEAPVVFAGYGFVSEKAGFNDLGKTDVKGKFILKLTGVPAFATVKLTRTEITQASREFENIARRRGAAGIIEINPEFTGSGSNIQADMSPSERVPRPYNTRSVYSLPGENQEQFTRVIISPKTADEILRETGNSIDEYQDKADKNQAYTFHPVSGKKLTLKTTLSTENIAVRNILGIIEGRNKDEIIVLGAHYDHMGMNNGYIWNGADDNGSGTVGIMTIAKAIMESGVMPEKTVIIALWTAEEQGLLGSEHFVKSLRIPPEQVKLYLNFDMISRYISDDVPNKVVMTYSDTEESFRALTAENLRKYNINLDVDYQPSADPPGGSDHRSFVAAGIPVMRFKPGHREEYHTPYDEISTVDFDIMEKIVKVSFLNIWELANSTW